MKKRDFIKTGAILTAGAMIAPLASCADTSKSTEKATKVATAAFTLPELPYAHEALEPFIDTQTMQIHHGKHHAGYVRKLNAALEGHDLAGKDLMTILKNVKPEDKGVRNNAGGHYNHSLYWSIMKPGGGTQASGKLLEALRAEFDGYPAFRETFVKAASTRFGSGWAWLCADANGKIFVTSTPNQDNPLMANLEGPKGTPLMGIDVWEHAYYLNYQNRRSDYVNTFMGNINWEQVAKNYDALGF